MSEFENKQRIIQEFVPGKQVTLAHVIAHPVADLYGKLGLFETEGAIGIFTITPSEGAMIAADIASKAANISIGYSRTPTVGRRPNETTRTGRRSPGT